jgi:hypothetical protein
MPDFRFSPEILFNAAKLRDEAGDAFGHVRVEVIANHPPRRGGRRRGEQIPRENAEVLFGTGIDDGATNFACGDIECGDRGLRAMPGVLELTPFDVSGLDGQVFRGTFQGLDPGHSSIETVCPPCSATAGAVR